MSLFLSIMMGGLGLRFSKLGAGRKPTASGGGGATLPDNTTSANEFLILFV